MLYLATPTTVMQKNKKTGIYNEWERDFQCYYYYYSFSTAAKEEEEAAQVFIYCSHFVATWAIYVSFGRQPEKQKNTRIVV